MNKEDFINKLESHISAIEKKNHEIAQSIADLNILIGHKDECLFWINKFDSKNKSEPNEKKINPINKIPLTIDSFKEMTGAKDAYVMKLNKNGDN